MRATAHGSWKSSLMWVVLSTVFIEPLQAQEKEDLANLDLADLMNMDIIVTPRKHEESLQRVPLSISAVSTDELERRSIDSLSELGQSTPNFTFGQQPQGGRSSNVIYIRGVGQRDTLSTYDSAVGIYLDGVYLSRMQGNDLEMLEIERVEILRGPQGTLFGKNTSGGALSVITRQPDSTAKDVTGRVQLITGSRGRFDLLGSANIPLASGKAALKLAGVQRKQNGYGHRIDGGDMNDADRSSLRAQFLIEPFSRFTALLAADRTHFDESNAMYKLVGVNTSIPTIAALNAFTTATYDERYITADRFSSFATGANLNRGTLWGTALTLTFDTDQATFKSISSYRDYSLRNDLDPDASPVTVINQFQTVAQRQASQELQATGKAWASRLDWVAGLYFFHEVARDTASYELFTPLFGDAAGFTQILHVTNDSYAAYAQGSYDLTGQWRVTAGLRYTRDDKEIVRSRVQFPSRAPLDLQVTRRQSSSASSPRLGMDYQWTPALMTYVSVAQGYKGGGFNGRASNVADFNEFEDEKVWTYELGLRSDLAERRLRLNLTGFYSDYSNLQLQAQGSQVVNGAPLPFNVVSNIPKARIVGGEAELALVPLTGMKLSGGLGFTSAKYIELPTDAQFVAAGTIDKDNKFPYTPELSYTVAAEYTTAILLDGIEATGRLDYVRQSAIYFNPENTPLLRQPAYGLLNARLAFKHKASRLSVAVFGNNLTNEQYILGGFDDAQSPSPGLGLAIVAQGAPREWGISAQLRF